MEYDEHDHCPNCGQAINWKEIRGGEEHGKKN
jgi:predicted nucleic acid-binding Zn ribbon protein